MSHWQKLQISNREWTVFQMLEHAPTREAMEKPRDHHSSIFRMDINATRSTIRDGRDTEKHGIVHHRNKSICSRKRRGNLPSQSAHLHHSSIHPNNLTWGIPQTLIHHSESKTRFRYQCAPVCWKLLQTFIRLKADSLWVKSWYTDSLVTLKRRSFITQEQLDV